VCLSACKYSTASRYFIVKIFIGVGMPVFDVFEQVVDGLQHQRDVPCFALPVCPAIAFRVAVVKLFSAGPPFDERFDRVAVG